MIRMVDKNGDGQEAFDAFLQNGYLPAGLGISVRHVQLTSHSSSKFTGGKSISILHTTHAHKQ
jgi:hypothetical protein